MIVLNPGFEDWSGSPADFDYWVEVPGNGTITAESPSHSGIYAARVEYTTGQAHIYQEINVTPNYTYQLKFWTFANVKAGKYGVYDVTNSTWIINQQTTGFYSSYTRIAEFFSIPDNCNTIRIYLYSPTFQPGPFANFAYFDDVSLEIIKKTPWSFNEITIVVEKDSQDYPNVRMGILNVLESTGTLVHFGGTEGYYRDLQFVMYSDYENQFEPLIGSGYYMFISDQGIEGNYSVVSAQPHQLQALNYNTVVYRVNVVLRKQ